MDTDIKPLSEEHFYTDEYSTMSVEDIARTMYTYRKLQNEYEEQAKKLQSLLLSRTDSSFTFEDEYGKTVTATIAKRTTHDPNLSLLRETNEDLYLSITKRVYDKSAFEELWSRGEISLEVAQSFMRERVTNYVMFTSPKESK